MSEKQERRIACLGDSNTFGYDPAAPLAARYPPFVRWTGRLAESGWQVFNRGMNGARVPLPGQFGAIAGQLGALAPLDAVAVMFGTNDLLQGAVAEDAGALLGDFLSALREAVPGPLPILIAPPPMKPGTWVRGPEIISESERFGARCRLLAAEQGIAFADAGAWDVPLTFDGVHFTPEGHEAFFRGLGSVLEELFPQRCPGES